MGDLPHYFDIILFAMVQAFLVLRPRSDPRPPHRAGTAARSDVPRRAEAPAEKIGDKVVALGSRAAAVRPPIATAPPADAVAAGLERIVSADPGFDPARSSSKGRGPPST